MLKTKVPVETMSAEIARKSITVTMSSEASEFLRDRDVPLVAEAEILFSCLIRKRLTFRDTSPDLLSWPITENLHVSVRPVLYELCRPENGESEPNLVDFAVADIAALVPKSFHIDIADGQLTGTFELG
ncbi:MAG: hypothetical protein JJE47_02670 [Acidimicrobiia bacterium]|nr:hypothetical protein [Acidimicrobiia bacterium]